MKNYRNIFSISFAAIVLMTREALTARIAVGGLLSKGNYLHNGRRIYGRLGVNRNS